MIASLVESETIKDLSKSQEKYLFNAVEMMSDPKTHKIINIYTWSIKDVILRWTNHTIKRGAHKIQVQNNSLKYLFKNCENSIQKSAIAEQVILKKMI